MLKYLNLAYGISLMLAVFSGLTDIVRYGHAGFFSVLFYTIFQLVIFSGLYMISENIGKHENWEANYNLLAIAGLTIFFLIFISIDNTNFWFFLLGNSLLLYFDAIFTIRYFKVLRFEYNLKEIIFSMLKLDFFDLLLNDNKDIPAKQETAEKIPDKNHESSEVLKEEKEDEWWKF